MYHIWVGLTVCYEALHRASEMRFQSGGTMKHWKVLSAIMVDRQETFSNSRRSRMVKTIIFDLSDSLLIVSALKPFLFSLCLPFFFLLRKKMRGTCPTWPPQCCQPCYIRVGEVEKKSTLRNYRMVPLMGYKKKKLAWNWFKKTYWKVKLGLLSYKVNQRRFSIKNVHLMVGCFRK